jgi:conjugative transfer signal peptidase TraF
MIRSLLLAAAATPLLCLACTHLTFNLTPSEPRGLYFLAPGTPRRGDFVAFAVPQTLTDLVRERHYLPPSVRLLKTLVGLPGDHVCIDETSYAVNHQVIATVLHADTRGRRLDPVHFCALVPPGQAFVASSAATSLDSRYAGGLPITSLTKAYPLWTY